MENLLFFIAMILIIVWGIGLFGHSAESILVILLALVAIAIIFKLAASSGEYDPRSLPSVRDQFAIIILLRLRLIKLLSH